MITKHYKTLLLAASIILAGCQTIATAPSKDIPHYGNIMTMQAADIDSDGDGILDEIDECPANPENVIVDERGCPFTTIGVGLKMEYRAFFEKGSSALLPKYQLELDKVAEQMNKHDIATMKIEAHASEDEIDRDSSSLPKNRALMVKNYLVSKHNIEPIRLSTFNCGARAPIASSDTEEGKFMNRRVYGLATEPENEIAYQQPNKVASTICVEF